MFGLITYLIAGLLILPFMRYFIFILLLISLHSISFSGELDSTTTSMNSTAKSSIRSGFETGHFRNDSGAGGRIKSL
jgi:hypothetical protein